ncbi:hypothetical protein GLOIN_2v1497532 [Rhizophagus irregularis DAOM 181602=DAOM 197198]|nr:hypothetical protein GLOIN_2v1497532 [Rhizophagus irregularis DAOM 181602=DAOM 197198]
MSECSPISRTDIKDVNIADWSVSGQLKIPSPYSQREYPNWLQSPEVPPVPPVPVNTNDLIDPYNYRKRSTLNEDSFGVRSSYPESDDISTSLYTEPSKQKTSSHLNDVFYLDDDFQITDLKSTSLYTEPFTDPKIISSRPLHPKSDDIKPGLTSLYTSTFDGPYFNDSNYQFTDPIGTSFYTEPPIDPKNSFDDLRSPKSDDIKPRRTSLLYTEPFTDLKSSFGSRYLDSEFDDINSFDDLRSPKSDNIKPRRISSRPLYSRYPKPRRTSFYTEPPTDPKSTSFYTEPPTDPKNSFDDLRSPKSDNIKPRRISSRPLYSRYPKPRHSFDDLRSPKSDGIKPRRTSFYTEPPTDPKSSFDDLRSPKSDDIKPRRISSRPLYPRYPKPRRTSLLYTEPFTDLKNSFDDLRSPKSDDIKPRRTSLYTEPFTDPKSSFNPKSDDIKPRRTPRFADQLEPKSSFDDLRSPKSDDIKPRRTPRAAGLPPIIISSRPLYPKSDDIKPSRTSLYTEPSKRFTDPKIISSQPLYPKSDNIKPSLTSLNTELPKLYTDPKIISSQPLYPKSDDIKPSLTSLNTEPPKLFTDPKIISSQPLYPKSDDIKPSFTSLNTEPPKLFTDPKIISSQPLYPKSDNIKPSLTSLNTEPPKLFTDPKIISSQPLYPKSDDIKPSLTSLNTEPQKLFTDPKIISSQPLYPKSDDIKPNLTSLNTEPPKLFTDPKIISSQPLYPKSDDIKPSPISYSTPKILPTSLNLQSSQSSHLNIPNNNDSKNDLTINPKTISYSTPKILPTSLNLQSSQSSHLNIPNNNDSKNDLTINPKIISLDTTKLNNQLDNATLTNKVKEKPENKSKVESGVSQLRRDKEQNKIDNTRVDHIKIPVVKSLPSWQKRFISLSSPSIPKLITNNQQVIQQLKLTHGLFINGYNIQPSEQAIVTEKGKLDMSLYNGQPIVYTNINDPVLSVNLLNFNSDENNFIINTLQPSDLCINFPIAEITYNSNFSESFSKYTDNDEKLYTLYGHIFARKTLIGGKLFIKELNLATLTQIDLLKSYIFWTYNSAKHNIENPINDLPFSYLPRIDTLDGLLLDTPEKLSNWFKDLYQNNVFDIISYKNLIPVTQFKNNPLTEENFEEKQPGVANFKEELSLKEWVGNVIYINLVRWIKDFHFLQGIIITKFYKMEISKKNAASFIKLPIVKSSNKSYLEIIRPTKKVEEFLINNNIFSIKDVSSFPFISIIQPNDSNYGDYNFLVKFEQYEIIIKNADHIKSSTEFEQAINNALNSMKPFKALHDVFDEYGHVFPQKIILGRSFIRNITKTYDIPNRIDLKSGTLESHLDKLNLSYLLTRSGNIIEKHELLDLVQNLNDDLEIIELDNIISLYEILDKEQQEKIDNIIAKYKQDNHRIIMSGITDLKDLDNNNTDHYKRINIQPSLEDENYEVIGSIISKQKNSKLKEFLLKFGLYDFNGFSAMIKTLKKTHIKIEECYILWMIIGIPSKLSVLSPRNQDLQVKYESVTLQPNQIKMKTPISLSQKYIISVNAHHSYEPINIRLVEWSESCISFQINGTTRNNSNIDLNIENIDDSNSFIMSDNDSDTQQETENNSSTNIETVVNNIECNICILRSDYKTFRIDNGDEEYPIDLIGYKLSEENFNENLTFSDE